MQLIRRFPLRPIRTKEEYAQASEIYAELADLAEAG